MACTSVAWTFGSGQRKGFAGNKMPGPGQYEEIQRNNVSSSQPSYSVGRSTRAQGGPIKGDHLMPGPGLYDLGDMLNKDGRSIGKKLAGMFDSNKGRSPGPGHYDAQKVTASVGGVKFGSRPASSYGTSKIGPGSYDLPSDFSTAASRSRQGKNTARGTFGSA